MEVAEVLRKTEQSTFRPRTELSTFAYFRGKKVEMERETKKTNKTTTTTTKKPKVSRRKEIIKIRSEINEKHEGNNNKD